MSVVYRLLHGPRSLSSSLSLIALLKRDFVHVVFSEGCTRGLFFKVNVLWMSSPLLSLGLFDAVNF